MQRSHQNPVPGSPHVSLHSGHVPAALGLTTFFAVVDIYADLTSDQLANILEIPAQKGDGLDVWEQVNIATIFQRNGF